MWATTLNLPTEDPPHGLSVLTRLIYDFASRSYFSFPSHVQPLALHHLVLLISRPLDTFSSSILILKRGLGITKERLAYTNNASFAFEQHCRSLRMPPYEQINVVVS